MALDMRELGVQRLIASRLNDTSNYPTDTEVPSFGRRAICGKCVGKRVDVRPNRKEQRWSEPEVPFAPGSDRNSRHPHRLKSAHKPTFRTPPLAGALPPL